MKNALFIILLMALPCMAISQIKSASLTASGLTCSMCSKSIYKALEKLPYVGAITVDIDKSTFEITFKAGSAVDIDGLKKAVEHAGFSVSSLKMIVNLEKVEVYNDAHVAVAQQTFHFLNVNKQTLQGEKTITIVDRNFVPAADYKKYKAYTQMKCVETGYMASCCPNSKDAKTRVYHVTL